MTTRLCEHKKARKKMIIIELPMRENKNIDMYYFFLVKGKEGALFKRWCQPSGGDGGESNEPKAAQENELGWWSNRSKNGSWGK
jgi:hypothetical protein